MCVSRVSVMATKVRAEKVRAADDGVRGGCVACKVREVHGA